MKIAGLNSYTGEGLIVQGVTMKNAYPTIAKEITDSLWGNIKEWSFAIGSEKVEDEELFQEIRAFSRVPSYKIGKD